jgi:hemerythrin-like metal-binding protein
MCGMQLFKWTKAHSVLVPQVDAEHRDLFRLAEELHQAVEAGAKASRIKNDMQALLAAVEEHFTHEERLMKAAACESYEWHKQQHNAMRKKGKQFLAAFAAGDRDVPQDFLAFLARWFRDHVAISDRMMSAQVRNSNRLAVTAS